MKSLEYQIVKTFYEGKKAKRSGLPYIKHIDDGLNILDALDASDITKRAWCLHPLVQADEDFVTNLKSLAACKPISVALAVEYRRVANSYLSTMPSMKPVLSPLREVNQMLIADKVQNYNDFKRSNSEHPRYSELVSYFHDWYEALDLTLKNIEELSSVCEIES